MPAPSGASNESFDSERPSAHRTLNFVRPPPASRDGPGEALESRFAVSGPSVDVVMKTGTVDPRGGPSSSGPTPARAIRTETGLSSSFILEAMALGPGWENRDPAGNRPPARVG